MADDLISFLEEGEESIYSPQKLSEVTDFPQTLVTEKIIFVVDILILANEFDNEINIHTILSLFKSYFNLKKKICMKPPEFECLLYNDKTVLHSYINSAKDLQAAFISIQNAEFEEEKQPLKIDKVFNKIANLVELPDSECSKKSLPPNWVYHVVWLFGRNLYVPTMENTNSFDFLMMTPYVALDILYLYNKNLEGNQCELISKALTGLNENGKGYFLSASVSRKSKLLSCFAQFLGHPLIRVPQFQAKFNILELGHQLDIKNNNNNNNNDDDDDDGGGGGGGDDGDDGNNDDNDDDDGGNDNSNEDD